MNPREQALDAAVAVMGHCGDHRRVLRAAEAFYQFLTGSPALSRARVLELMRQGNADDEA